MARREGGQCPTQRREWRAEIVGDKKEVNASDGMESDKRCTKVPQAFLTCHR